MRPKLRILVVLQAVATATLATTALVAAPAAWADPIAVVHPEGMAHGFVVLHALDGTLLASGDLTQRTKGKQVTVRLRFEFKDGSLHEETTVYLQSGTFRLVSNHVVQKGPAFKTQVDSRIHRDGRVTVRYAEEDGEEKVEEERMKLPPDVANGLLMLVAKNLPADAPKTTVSFVAITPKPRLVQLEITPAGEEPFTTAGIQRKAMNYVVKVHVPGITGAVASILGKIPPDTHLWVLRGDAPAFIKAEAPLSMGGDVWRIEMVAPTWPSGGGTRSAAAKQP